jgi:hypothetical protein
VSDSPMNHSVIQTSEGGAGAMIIAAKISSGGAELRRRSRPSFHIRREPVHNDTPGHELPTLALHSTVLSQSPAPKTLRLRSAAQRLEPAAPRELFGG